MTRRASRPQRVLSVDQYIHRVTLGLPQAERLDAAAELRTHLLERIAEHQAQGFDRAEAEYLAVKSMGEAEPVNRQLLGHTFTHTTGWAVLALLLVGAGGWFGWQYLQRDWLPPPEGIRFEKPSAEDLTRLFSLKDAPRSAYQAATLTYPKGTKGVVYALLASEDGSANPAYPTLNSKNVAAEERLNFQTVGRPPGSYRYQERWLFTTWHMTCQGQARSGLYVDFQPVKSRFFGGDFSLVSQQLRVTEPCRNPSVKLRQVTDRFTHPNGTVQVSQRTIPANGEMLLLQTLNSKPEPLHLNKWTVLHRLIVDPAADPNRMGSPSEGYSPKTRAVALMVMPVTVAVNDLSYSLKNNQIQLENVPVALPPIPRLVPTDPSQP